MAGMENRRGVIRGFGEAFRAMAGMENRRGVIRGFVGAF